MNKPAKLTSSAAHAPVSLHSSIGLRSHFLKLYFPASRRKPVFKRSADRFFSTRRRRDVHETTRQLEDVVTVRVRNLFGSRQLSQMFLGKLRGIASIRVSELRTARRLFSPSSVHTSCFYHAASICAEDECTEKRGWIGELELLFIDIDQSKVGTKSVLDLSLNIEREALIVSVNEYEWEWDHYVKDFLPL